MINKTFLSLLIILPVILGGTVSVGDNQPWDIYAFSTIYKLGRLYINEVVSISFQYGTIVPADSFTFYIKSADNTVIISTLTCTTNPCYANFVPISATADYILQLKYTGPYAISALPAVKVGQLSVTGNNPSRTTQILLQITTTVAPFRFHRIKLVQTRNVQVFFKYASVDQNIYFTGGMIKLVTQSTAGFYSLIGGAITQSSTSTIDFFNSKVIFNNIAPGNYWIVVDYNYPLADPTLKTNLLTQNLLWQISYTTDQYPCPYDSNYPDVTGLFQGCVFPSANIGLPCISYDSINLVCLQCLTGYTLTVGRCLQNQCPNGQYKQYGQCMNNPTGCLNYTDFTKCTNCTANYTLINGSCVRNLIVCADRFWFDSVAYVCNPVNIQCLNYNTSSGACLTCAQTQFTVINGSCINVTNICTSVQYISNGVCFNSDPSCQTFQKVGGKCLSCIFGYKFANSTSTSCVLFTCPNRFVPNRYGNCFRVSDLCLNYTFDGSCLACIPSHYLVPNGQCLQIIAPYPCGPRQYLGFGGCANASANCQVFVQLTGQCQKCAYGFDLQYTGQCVKSTTCTQRQYIVNNVCYDVSPTCLTFDPKTGKCLSCLPYIFQLYYGLCIPLVTCGSRQWTDSFNVCRDVKPQCLTFNPSTGDCISCVHGYNYSNGICCLTGFVNVHQVCVASATASTNSNGCLVSYPGYGCLQCYNTFTISYDQNGLGICIRN